MASYVFCFYLVNLINIFLQKTCAYKHQGHDTVLINKMMAIADSLNI